MTAENKTIAPVKSKVEALAELEKQRQELTNKIESERAEAVAEIVSHAKKSAEQIGVSMDELLRAFGKRDSVKKSHKRAEAPAKYRNPQNQSETWAGRGRQPLWIAIALKSGATLESLAIKA